MKILVVGIDIGGTNTVLALVDENKKIYGEGSFPTRDYTDFDQYILAIKRTILDISAKIDIEHTIGAIGIGAPTANYYTGCLNNAVNLVWKGTILPIAEKMSAQFNGIPVAITNDANAAAMGEMIYGGAKGMKNFVVITLGTGLGSGFVVNGDILYGKDGFAGEFGHIVIEKQNGRECGCGKSGCLETYVSATGVKRTAFELMAKLNVPSKLRSIPFDKLTSKDIAIAANEGDALANEVYRVSGEILGAALADLVAITAPEAIFLFGGVAKSGDLILNPAKKYMEENLLSFWKGTVKLEISSLDSENSAILGSAALALQELNKIKK